MIHGTLLRGTGTGLGPTTPVPSRASSAGSEPFQLARGRRLGRSLDAPAGHPFIDCWRRARRLIHAIWACRAQRGQGAPATVGTCRLCRPTRPRSAAQRAERSEVCWTRVARFPYALFLLRLLFHVRSVSGGLERLCIRRNRWYVPVRTLGHLARSACTVRCCFAWSWPSDAVRSDRRAWHRRTDALSQSREVRVARSSPPVRMLALVGLSKPPMASQYLAACLLPQLRHRAVRRSIAVVVGALDQPVVAPRSGFRLIVWRSLLRLSPRPASGTVVGIARTTAVVPALVAPRPRRAAGPSQLLRSSRGRIKKKASSAGLASANRHLSGPRMGPDASRSRLDGVHHWAVGGPRRIGVFRRSRRQRPASRSGSMLGTCWTRA
ncbi:hypothetical protein JOF29_000195 [Kribbella aluminosa]|uniref:Uncharacterized protein n=1 Tax=Kribbella aluminosa TaxID=416017 RepID=A0ABS4UBV1_9ACTN|nr:hypothetical protein [Kribbella aluminosa]